MQSRSRAILILTTFLVPSFGLLVAPVDYVDESLFFADLTALSFVVTHGGG